MKKDWLQLKLSNIWTKQEGVAVVGYAYCGDKLLTGESLASYFCSASTIDDFTESLKRLNGIFSVVIINESFTASAIDTTRIYPVFYTYKHGKWVVTDNPYLLLSDDSRISSVALKQMRSSYAPLQGNTLIEGIYQVKPGSVVEFCDGGKAETSVYFHYNVFANELKKAEKSELLSVLEDAITRLVKRANGRQIVVPISAGYDSRIILCLLKQLGYHNVLTYTMGANDSASEVSIASKVADTLGYAHYQIDFSLLAGECDFSDFNDYVKHLGALTNFSWCGEYASVKWLQAKGLLQDGAIFVPGHAGDFFAGSHLSKSLIDENSSRRALIYGILFNNFEANRGLSTYSISQEFNTIESFGNYPPSLYNAFVFANRLTHFITNSARAYTFFGYDVMFPLWDIEFLHLMRKLPMEQLHQCTLYNECVQQVFVRYNVNFPKAKLPRSAYLKQYIKNVISSLLPSALLHKKQVIDILGTWHLANILCKDFSLFASKAPKPYSINSALTEWYIGTITKLLNKK